MERDIRRQRFTVIQGGLETRAATTGPITRLGLRDRFPVISAKTWAIVLLSKVLLLGSVLYYVWG